jgi:hypothetical protein
MEPAGVSRYSASRLVDFTGKDPLVDRSADWARLHEQERHRSSERHRVRRRTRVPNPTRSRIRLRVWLACTGALLVMAIGIFLALGHAAG